MSEANASPPRSASALSRSLKKPRMHVKMSATRISASCLRCLLRLRATALALRVLRLRATALALRGGLAFAPLGAALAIAGVFLVAPFPLSAQDPLKGKLAAVKGIKCTFPLMVVGTWAGEQPKAEVKPSKLVLEFEGINADEGTAQLKSSYGQYDITVRYADGYLHFIQSFLNGPLYTTTVLEKKTADGKLKAMHSRHEFTDFALAGFTSSPEQYYGECEIVN